MRVRHVFAGDDGRSHAVERELPAFLSTLGTTSADIAASSVAFRDTGDAAPSTQFRPAPRRQLVVLLRGRVEYELSDGSAFACGVGDIVLFDDTEGRGHRARAVDGPRTQLFVRLPGDVDVASWTTPKEITA